MVAYFAAGAPLLISFINVLFDLSITGWISNAIFGIFFGIIVGVGLKFVDRVNYILMIALIVSYVALVTGGSVNIDLTKLEYQNWSKVFIAAPVLFSAFGFHNVIPSLTFHFKADGRVMRYGIFFGTLLPLVIYIIWQFLIIGVIPIDVVQNALKQGLPITEALQSLTGLGWVKAAGKFFGLFAIITSMIGVSFSVVDFLGDGLKLKRHGKDRFILCLLTFIPPFILTTLDPSIFVLAIGIAGGFGEAFLNGILPAWLVWIGRYKHKLKSDYQLFGSKFILILLLLIGILVMLLEIIYLINHK